jgi:hypothetical protein
MFATPIATFEAQEGAEAEFSEVASPPVPPQPPEILDRIHT